MSENNVSVGASQRASADKVCPVMSTGSKLAKCLGANCALWNSYGDGGCTLADRRRFMTELRRG